MTGWNPEADRQAQQESRGQCRTGRDLRESYTGSAARTRRKSSCHCLLLDRRDRRAHISQRDQIMMLFALGEPEEGDGHNVLVGGLLMSPGSENDKLPPALDCWWVDVQMGQVRLGF